MPTVQTVKGFIERSDLDVQDVVTENDNARKIVTRWLYNGDEVRTDVTISIFRGLEIASTQESLGEKEQPNG